MEEDVKKIKSQLTLDINIERGRSKDEQALIEKSIAALTTHMTAELGNLQTTFERYKNDIYKFIVGSVVSGVTLGFTIYRVFKT